ncbi:MAG: hypothetical protein OXH16_07600 [Gemmatimonadetes bacterium]|nr:hypothetical protein [Gemmatimonadota bacterium]
MRFIQNADDQTEIGIPINVIWSYPASDAVAEFRILSRCNETQGLQNLYSGTNSRFSNRRFPIDQFGNSIALVEYLGLGFQACD